MSEEFDLEGEASVKNRQWWFNTLAVGSLALGGVMALPLFKEQYVITGLMLALFYAAILGCGCLLLIRSYKIENETDAMGLGAGGSFAMIPVALAGLATSDWLARMAPSLGLF